MIKFNTCRQFCGRLSAIGEQHHLRIGLFGILHCSNKRVCKYLVDFLESGTVMTDRGKAVTVFNLIGHFALWAFRWEFSFRIRHLLM